MKKMTVLFVFRMKIVGCLFKNPWSNPEPHRFGIEREPYSQEQFLHGGQITQINYKQFQ